MLIDGFRQLVLVALQTFRPMGSLPFPTLQLDIAEAALRLPNKHLAAPASLPVPNPSRSFWIDSPGANVLAKEGSEGNLTTEADVCIIGSGITGVSAAYHLAKLFKDGDQKAPVKAVILEARDFCSGATGRNGGHLTPAVFTRFVTREAQYGAKEAKKAYDLEKYTTDELVKIVEAEGLGGLIDLIYSRHILLLVTEQEEQAAHKDVEAAKAAGLNMESVQWKSKEEMFSEYGTSFPAYTFPGHNLWPLKLVTQLYHLARKLNPDKLSLALHTSTPVTSITTISPSSSAHRWSLSTPRGSIKCSYVIHATNAYASHLLPHMHGPGGIVPTRGQAMALRAATPLSEISTASWDANEGSEYWFPRPVKEKGEHPLMIIGGGREVTGPEWEYYVTDDSVVREDVSKVLRGSLPALFPGKYEEGKSPEMEWTGIMGYTAVGDPFVGPVAGPSTAGAGTGAAGYEGQYIAAGYRGHGMPRGYACAEVVAGMVAADLMGANWTAPEWLPRHFLTTERL